MKVQESIYVNEVLEVFPCPVGKVFLFKNIVLLEINSGVHLTFDNTQSFIKKIKSFYAKKSAVGFISNRVNTYSSEVLDYKKLFNKLLMIKTFSIVYYNLQTAYNIEIEKKISNVPFVGFKNLTEAFIYTKATLKR